MIYIRATGYDLLLPTGTLPKPRPRDPPEKPGQFAAIAEHLGQSADRLLPTISVLLPFHPDLGPKHWSLLLVSSDGAVHRVLSANRAFAFSVSGLQPWMRKGLGFDSGDFASFQELAAIEFEAL